MHKAIRLAFFSFLLMCGSPLAVEQALAEPGRHRTPIYTEGGSEDCLRCHSGNKMRDVAESPHGDGTSPFSPAANHDCESCHGPGSIHISRAHGGRGFPLLTQFGRGKEVSPRATQLAACLGCHGAESEIEPRIVFLGSPHDRNNINCSTCHTVHAVSDPLKEPETQYQTCNRCHRRDMENHRKMNFDRVSCSRCHDVHAPVTEEAEGALTERQSP